MLGKVKGSIIVIYMTTGMEVKINKFELSSPASLQDCCTYC